LNKSFDDILFQKIEFEIYIFTWLLGRFPFSDNNFSLTVALKVYHQKLFSNFIVKFAPFQKKKFLLQGEVKKVWLAAPCAKFVLFFGNFFFGTPMAKEKFWKHFFLLISKVQ